MQSILRLIEKLMEAIKRRNFLDDYLDYVDHAHESDQDYLLLAVVGVLCELDAVAIIGFSI